MQGILMTISLILLGLSLGLVTVALLDWWKGRGE